MRIYIPRLSFSVTEKHLRDFASELLEAKLRLPLTAKPSLDDWEIFSVTDHYGVEERHGLISITPDSAARWFIKTARGKTLANKRVLLREYIERKADSSDYPPEQCRRSPQSPTKLGYKVQVQTMEKYE